MKKNAKINASAVPAMDRIWSFGNYTAVRRLTWSSDGATLVAATLDGGLEIFDAETGRRLRAFDQRSDTIALSPDSSMIAASAGGEVRMWHAATGELVAELKGHRARITDIAWAPDGHAIASSSLDFTVRVWSSIPRKRALRIFKIGERSVALAVRWASDNERIAVASYSGWIWNSRNGEVLKRLPARGLYDIAWSHQLPLCIAGAASDGTVGIWDPERGKPIVTLEGHTEQAAAVAFSPDGKFIAALAIDGSVRLWRCEDWRSVAILPSSGHSGGGWLNRGLAFHPYKPLLACGRRDQDASASQIEVWEFNPVTLSTRDVAPTIKYTTAKIVLVGDSGAGKTGLGWRLAHDAFKEHASTHGQQFWLLPQLQKARSDGTECEAILWDLAGQPDYRMIHALFLDDADVAILVFDPTRPEDPLRGVEFWLRQLKVVSPGSDSSGNPNLPVILVAARVDRGMGRLTPEDMQVFCRNRGVKRCIYTSAVTGAGLPELVNEIRELIAWDEKPATVTTAAFKRIKDNVLGLKENSRRRDLILTPAGLRRHLHKRSRRWNFGDDEMLTAVDHLAKHGYVSRLRTSRGESRILLRPELLNNLAASLIIEARRNAKGLGSLEEQALLAGQYAFPELPKLSLSDRDVLIDSAVVMFMNHNVCFRETDPLTSRAYLVFPELINLKKPPIDADVHLEDGVAYTVAGAVQNVYASLVVLLGYTQTFTRTNQWRDQARYEVGSGLICGFRLEAEREGELDFVLYYGMNVGGTVRTLFQSLFESFLARRELTVFRFEPVRCSSGHHLNRAVLREQALAGSEVAFCAKCGERLTLAKADRPIYLRKEDAEQVEAQHFTASQRSRFEQVLFRLKSHVTDNGVPSPSCFVSYAWGDTAEERWVERNLATDLVKAGVDVVLDKWENARIGSSVPRFVERVAKCEYVIVVGTPQYRTKYENGDPMRGFVLAAEGDLIGRRMIGSEHDKATIFPVVRRGTDGLSLPELLRGRVYADFRDDSMYFGATLDLALDLYGISRHDPVSVELRESLTMPAL